MEIKYIQSFLKNAGENGCNALCIIKNANKWLTEHEEKEWNYLDALKAGIEKKYINFNEANYDDADNFYVVNGEGFMSYLTKVPWRMSVEDGEYICHLGEMEIQFWAWSDERAKKGIGHFITPNENTLQYSKSVSQGMCYSKRVYRQV